MPHKPKNPAAGHVNEAVQDLMASPSGPSGRVFEVCTSGGWVRTPPHQIIMGRTFRVRDNGTLTPLTPELVPDPGAYIAAQVQAEGVHFAVRLATGETLDRVVALEAP